MVLLARVRFLVLEQRRERSAIRRLQTFLRTVFLDVAARRRGSKVVPVVATVLFRARSVPARVLEGPPDNLELTAQRLERSGTDAEVYCGLAQRAVKKLREHI